MKNTDHEQEARLTMESLDHIGKADMPANLERDFLARLERVQQEDGKRAKWFWAAAVVLFIVNGTIAFNYMTAKSENETGTTASTDQNSDQRTTFTDFYYGNSGSWYQ